ncbi:MAG: YkgJ family cysteine cluster protein [Candidatus Gastranaerophilales bacterium]|nr:YkgJ family cysteine cluster protein [Candidatus Gastranaerophilales bacterium]
MINYLKTHWFEIRKFFAKITGKKYVRIGSCKSCGRCCQSIYVRTASHIIKDEEEFEKLKNQHFFYTYLKVVDKNDTGLVFECTKLDKEKGICTAYKQRALLCRLYPQEEVFTMGGTISEDCGYKFIPVESFENILNKVQKSSKSFFD